MNAKSLQEYFGKLVVIQFTEAVALVVPKESEPTVEAELNALGQPQIGITERGPALRQAGYWPVKPIENAEERYTLLVEGRVFPSQDESRVIVAYEHTTPGGAYIVRMSVAPAHILAVSTIMERNTERRVLTS